MAKRNAEEVIIPLGGAGNETHLTKAGKEQLLEAIEKYIVAVIDLRTLPIRPTLYQQKQVKKAIAESRKLLKEMLDSIVIRVEE